MSVKVRPYRRGGWEVDVTVRLPNGARWRERSKAPVLVEIRGRPMGRGSRVACAAARSTPTQEGGAHTRRVRAQVPRRSRTCEPSETKRHRVEGVDSPSTSDSAARFEEAGRDHDRTRAEPEASFARPCAENREQRARGAERAAQESGGVGRD